MPDPTIEQLQQQIADLKAERDEARELLALAAHEINCAGLVHERIRVLKREFAVLLTALEAAAQFLDPEIDRGPNVNGWANTKMLVDEALLAPSSPADKEPK